MCTTDGGILMYSNLVPVPARRHPMQVLVAVMLLLSGLSILAGGPRPGSINTALPTPLLLVWAGVLTACGALVVLAAVVPPLLALYFELVADLPLAVMCLVYAAAALMVAGPRAAVLVALVTAVALAFVVRAIQVVRTLRAVRRHISGK